MHVTFMLPWMVMKSSKDTPEIAMLAIPEAMEQFNEPLMEMPSVIPLFVRKGARIRFHVCSR